MKRDKLIQIRVDEAEKQSIDCEAYKEGIPTSEYLLRAHKAMIAKAGICPFCFQKRKD